MENSKIIEQCKRNQAKQQTYNTDDVIMLVDTLEQFNFTNVEEKERLIQSEQKHYSEMLSKESLPQKQQLDIYYQSLERYGAKIADGVMYLTDSIKQKMIEKKKNSVVLVSLIRAGLPLGVLLHRNLKQNHINSYHYGVSIIRDKGIDKVAMNTIKEAHNDSLIVFIDGWIGKGSITRELQKSCAELNIEPLFYTLSDPTCELSTDSPYSSDWLIPFGILGSVISGLSSRSIYQKNKLHSVIYYNSPEFKKSDLTYHFINYIEKQKETRQPLPTSEFSPITKRDGVDELLGVAQEYSEQDIIMLCKDIMKRYNVTNINYVKPSIAEATRAVLRRVPEIVLVKDKSDPDLALLLALCKDNNVLVEEINTAPYRAITIIKKS